MNNILFENTDLLFAEVRSEEVFKNTYRLDSQYHILFKDNLESLSIDNYDNLEECCDSIYEVPPFKHIYVEKGIPFYTSSDLFNNEFIPSHYLTADMPNIDSYKIYKGQILMARSGNVEGGVLGQLMIVGDRLNDATTSDHVLRFSVNKDKINLGYLKIFLESEFCKGQILKNAAGAVIPAIRPDSLKELQVPRLDAEIEKNIGNNALKALSNLEKAITLLEKARALVLTYKHLPSLEEAELETLDPDKETDLRLVSSEEFTDDFRLDAHFYNPMAALTVRNIRENADKLPKLFNVASSIFMCNRFSRNYVEKEQGLPFLSGKNIIQIRPEAKYISLTETNKLEELIVKKGWILITRSGTLGRVGYIWNNYEDYTATEDIIRIVPNEDIDSGYLYAFLSSEYGYHQIMRYKHGAVIDHITPEQIADILIPIPNENKIIEIGDLVRQAYDLRAEAIRLENEAQEILTKSLTSKE